MKEIIINEGTTVGDITSNPELVDGLTRKMEYGNLSAMVSDVRKLNRPGGKIQGIYRDKALDKLVIKETLVDVASTKVKTEFTEETIQDLYSIYGENVYEVLADFLAAEVNEELNIDLFTFLDTHASVGTTLTFTNGTMKATGDVIYNIKTKLSIELVRLAKANKRPIRGFAIVSAGIATAMMVDGYATLADRENESASNLYIGTLGAIDYYMNPFHTDLIDVAYVGLKGTGFSGGSLYYLPYNNTILNAVDADTGAKNLFILNRSKIALNPFDESTGTQDSTFLTKVSIDISDYNY